MNTDHTVNVEMVATLIAEEGHTPGQLCNEATGVTVEEVRAEIARRYGGEELLSALARCR